MCCDKYLMQSLAAVFVGGRWRPEKPNARARGGPMLVSTLENGLTICDVSYYVLPLSWGGVLALARNRAYGAKRNYKRRSVFGRRQAGGLLRPSRAQSARWNGPTGRDFASLCYEFV
jgi:hypothetical protein